MLTIIRKGWVESEMKKIAKGLVLLICSFLFVSCGESKISDEEMNHVGPIIVSILDDLDNEKYQAVNHRFFGDLKTEVPATKIEEDWKDKKESLGERKSFDYTKDCTYKKDGDNIVATVNAEYESGKANIQITFDKNYFVTGFEIK